MTHIVKDIKEELSDHETRIKDWVVDNLSTLVVAGVATLIILALVMAR